MKAGDRVSKCRWIFTAGAVLIALLMTAPGLLAQQAPGSSDASALQRIYEADKHRSALQSAIANNRQAVVSQVADSWVQIGQERGYSAGWREELELALNSLCDDKLAAAHDASSYDEVVNIITGRTSSRKTSSPQGLSTSGIKLLGDDDQDLVFFQVTPCREIDTRFGGGPIAAGATRNFVVNGNMTAQGGDAGGCGIPVDPAAVVLTLTATEENGAGNLLAYPLGAPVPLSSVLNYRAGVDIANTTVVPVCQICGFDITLKTNGASSGTQVVGDVVGYFWSPHHTPLQVVNVVGADAACANGGNCTATAVCPAGYSLVGGGFGNSAFIANNDWVWNAPDNFGLSTTTWLAQTKNASGSALTINAIAMCARIPGR